MNQRPSVGLNQSTRLALTPGQRLSVEILAMSRAELVDAIAAELDENPVLAERPSGSVPIPELPDVPAMMSPVSELVADIRLVRARPEVIDAAVVLAYSLDGEGYLREPLEQLAGDTGIEPSLLADGLAVLRAAGPPGIGAANVRECIALQLAESDLSPEDAALVVAHLEDFAVRNFDALRQSTGLDPETLERLADSLGDLSLRPLEDRQAPVQPPLYPDIRVESTPDGRLRVELEAGRRPELFIDMPTDAAGAGALKFLDSWRNRAGALLSALDRRDATLLAVGQAIVAAQTEFFLGTEPVIRPLRQADIAAETGLHASTVSRAVRGSALACRRGVFPLGVFFSREVTAMQGPPLSARDVKARVARMIADEPPDAPLSDAQIRAELRRSGVDISRRTVAKYRQCQRIPSSHARRRRFRSET